MSKNEFGEALIGQTTFILLIFIILKVSHSIQWAWVWVLSPFWGMILIGWLILTVWVLNDIFKRKN
jgi:hypothetical protein